MTRLAYVLLLFADGLLPSAVGLSAATPEPVAIAALPKLPSGVPAYPVPFMAVARTPYTIAPLPGRAINIQTDFGYPAGFSGLVDAAIGSVGYPGYRNFSNLDVAYDAEKLCLLVCMPYPYGRKTRAQATEPSPALYGRRRVRGARRSRDEQGRSKGPLYRVVGNAAGVCRIDRDLPQIGQPHQPWQAAVKYGSMMWDPMGSWMAAVQIPFRDLGGAPKDGQVWGIQAALRYADPKITAVLSPTDEFTHPARFARLRFDAGRRANYRCHWLLADEIQQGTFCVGGIFSNGAQEPAWFDGRVTLHKGDRPLGGGTFAHAARPLSNYDGDMQPCRFPSHPAGPTERDTVARLVVIDRQAGTIVYDQFLPYWQMAPGERDWLKRHFAKEFTFQAGPYPSLRCDRLPHRLPDADGGPARGGPGRGDGRQRRPAVGPPGAAAAGDCPLRPCEQRQAVGPDRRRPHDRRRELRDRRGHRRQRRAAPEHEARNLHAEGHALRDRPEGRTWRTSCRRPSRRRRSDAAASPASGGPTSTGRAASWKVSSPPGRSCSPRRPP